MFPGIVYDLDSFKWPDVHFSLRVAIGSLFIESLRSSLNRDITLAPPNMHTIFEKKVDSSFSYRVQYEISMAAGVVQRS